MTQKSLMKERKSTVLPLEIVIHQLRDPILKSTVVYTTIVGKIKLFLRE